MDRGYVEHLDERLWICLYGFLCIFGIQYMYGKSSSSSLLYSKWSEERFDIYNNVVVQHFWCRKIREIVCRVHREWVKSKFLCQDADAMSLADKCIVVGCFVCGDYDKILMETGKFSNNTRVTENGLVSGVDTVIKSSNSTF